MLSESMSRSSELLLLELDQLELPEDEEGLGLGLFPAVTAAVDAEKVRGLNSI